MDKDVEFFAKKFNVSRETIEKLNKYKDFLVSSNKLLNLIGKTTENYIFSRHFTDSAQIYDFLLFFLLNSIIYYCLLENLYIYLTFLLFHVKH